MATTSATIVDRQGSAVEIDETYVGGKRKNKHGSRGMRGRDNDEKTPVFGMVERGGKGRVLAYGNGHEEGVIAADNLNPQKSALLLSLALAQSTNAADIQRIFDEY